MKKEKKIGLYREDQKYIYIHSDNTAILVDYPTKIVKCKKNKYGF